MVGEVLELRVSGLQVHHLKSLAMLSTLLCLLLYLFVNPPLPVEDPGEGPGGPPPCPFLAQTGARRAEKVVFGDQAPPPPYLRLWMTGILPPLSGSVTDHWLCIRKTYCYYCARDLKLKLKSQIKKIA